MHPEDFLSPDEFQQLLASCRTSRERAMLYVLGGVGLRMSEAAGLEISDLDISTGYIYIRAENGKGHKQRTCVLAPPVSEAFTLYSFRLSLCGW